MGKFTWTDEEFNLLLMWRNVGVGFSICGKRLGKTKNACISKYHRYLYPDRRYEKKGGSRKAPRTYSDEALTEPWEARKLRLARERAARENEKKI